MLIDKLNLADNIFLLGIKSNPFDYLKNAQIFSFVSTSEGFPNALGEAMAAGCACLSFNCITGPSELIDDAKNGFLIPVGNHELYIEKLKLLMLDEKIRNRLSVAAIEKIKQYYNVENIAEKYLDLTNK